MTMQIRRNIKPLVLGAAASLVTFAVADAHHSYGATYDVKNEIKLEGELVQFQFRNPHSFVQVEAPDEHGEMQRWSVEWSGTGALLRQGVDRATLRPGDEVVITARPSRAPGERRVLMLTLLRPLDGLSWGNRPDEVTD
jgi:hypothetical protein